MSTGSLPQLVRILVLEDREDDFALIQRELSRAGITCHLLRIETPMELQKMLLEEEWDIILSDFNLPQMNALSALRIVSEARPDIPFVVISGSIGEEQAVDLIRAGASDYLMKDRLARLPSVVLRELRDTQSLRERQLLERQLRHLQKIEALGALAGGIVHDVNNSLTAICGFGGLALMEVEPDSPIREHLEQIMHAAERSREVARRILKFTRREDGKRAEPLDLAVPLDGAVAMLRATLPSSISLNTEFEGDKHFCVGSAEEIEQVLLNLCTNAAYAIGPRSGRIDIRLEYVTVHESQRFQIVAPGNYHCLHVKDSGPGIPPELRDRIFEPFFTTKPAGEGTGLGLAMAQRLLVEMGGSISCESTVGVGTEFLLYFPAFERRSLPGISAQSEGELGFGQGQHIMVVDDEALLVHLTAKILQQHGYRVSKFFDPSSALDAFIADPDGFDLLMTDLAMPGMTGLELAGHFHTIRPEMKVIVRSGYAGESGIPYYKSCNAVIGKPCSREDLLLAVQNVLSGQIVRQPE